MLYERKNALRIKKENNFIFSNLIGEAFKSQIS